MMSARVCAVVWSGLILAGGVSSTEAHDFWIEPSAFHGEVGDRIGVALRVGEHMVGEPVARNPDRIEKFFSHVNDRSTPIDGNAGDEPAGTLLAKEKGLHILVYRSRPSFIELEPDKFEDYLKEEGLEHVIALRKEKGQSSQPGRESYSRAAKSLLTIGSGPFKPDASIGLPLELVALTELPSIREGGDFSVRLEFQGKPLANAMVSAMSKTNPAERMDIRSNAEGVVVFKLNRSGLWLIKCVHMVSVQTEKADWESFWASLSLNVPKASKDDGSSDSKNR